MKKILLSISVLCSGRKETKKCLDSLKTLRERIPSELILVDTGCDDGMKKLLRKYGAKVTEFTWCGDFAKARNEGIRLARGEWFMYLDDDEWFIDTKAIEDFFLSGEYKQYGSANYYQRNYLNREGTAWRDNWVTRMTLLAQNVRMKGIIHERFVPLFVPFKILPSYVEHYGYVYTSPEEAKKHSERNVTLLEKWMAEDRGDVHAWAYLVQEYISLRDYKKLKEFCGQALQQFRDADSLTVNKGIGCFYCGLLEARWNLFEFREGMQDYEHALADPRNTDFCVARLMVYGADFADFLEDGERMSECCTRYIELWGKWQKDQDGFLVQSTVLVGDAFSDDLRDKMLCRRICIDLKKGSTDSLKKYFDLIDREGRKSAVTDELLPVLARAMETFPCEEVFLHIIDVWKNRPEIGRLRDELEKAEEKEELRNLDRLFFHVLIPSFEHYRYIVDGYFSRASFKKLENLWELFRDEAIGGALSVRREYFLLKLEEAFLAPDVGNKEGSSADTPERKEGSGLDALKDIGSKQRERLLSYAERCLKFYGRFFRESAFEGETAFLPESCRRALRLKEMLQGF